MRGNNRLAKAKRNAWTGFNDRQATGNNQNTTFTEKSCQAG
jgi:hypothetical protein